jgi:hypothetical protein
VLVKAQDFDIAFGKHGLLEIIHWSFPISLTLAERSFYSLTSGSNSLINGYMSFPTFTLHRSMKRISVSLLLLASSLLILSIIVHKRAKAGVGYLLIHSRGLSMAETAGGGGGRTSGSSCDCDGPASALRSASNAR